MPGLWVRASPGAHFLTRKRHLSRDTKPNFSGISLQIHSFHWIDWTDKTQGQPNRMADRCIQHEGCINLHLTNTKGWGVEGGPLSAHVGNGRRWRSQTSKWAQMRRLLAVVPRAGVWGGCPRIVGTGAEWMDRQVRRWLSDLRDFTCLRSFWAWEKTNNWTIYWRISCNFISIDSAWWDLHFCLWVWFNWMNSLKDISRKLI